MKTITLVKTLICCTFLYSSLTLAVVIDISNYGVFGDGVRDDRAAFERAINDLLRHSASEEKILRLQSNKTYFLRRTASGSGIEAIFDLSNKSNVTIDGNNSLLSLQRFDIGFFLYNSKNINIKNIKLDYKVPNFTQGTISALNPGTRSFTLSLDPGYPVPPNLTQINNRNSASPWANSSTFSTSGQYLRINIFIKKVENLGSGNLRVTYTDSAKIDEINKLNVGQKFVFRTHGSTEPGHQIEVYESEDVYIDNVAIYNTMKMGINGKHNSGDLTISNVKIQPRPGSGRMVSAVSDGIHLKSNRAQITITNSLIERNLDDAINLGAMAEFIHRMHSSTDIEIRDVSLPKASHLPGSARYTSPELNVGDEIYAFNVDNDGEQLFLGKSTITSVTPVNVNGNSERVRRIRLSTPIANMVPLDANTSINVYASNLRQNHATRIYIPNTSNPNFKVTYNMLRDKTRSGMLVKGFGGLIRGNNFINLDGYGVFAMNGNSFNEGPVPIEMEISANTFLNTRLYGVVLGVSAFQNKAGLMPSNSQIVHNKFSLNQSFSIDPSGTRILVRNVSDVNLTGNVFNGVNSTVVNTNAQTLTNTTFRSLWRQSGTNGIFYYANDTYCHVPSMNRLRATWGDNWTDYYTVADNLPKQRTFTGFCKPNEGVVRLAGGGLYRYRDDGTMCWFPNMDIFRRSIGVNSAASLPITSAPDIIAAAQGAPACKI